MPELNETIYTGLNIKKVENNPNVDKYRNALLSTIMHYSVPNNALHHPTNNVIEGALRLLTGYDIQPDFVTDNERNLFVLAIADTWLTNKSLSEKKALLDILKLIATESNNEGHVVSYSDKVVRLSSHGSYRGIDFDPSVEQNSPEEFMSKILNYIHDNEDKDKTNEFSLKVSDWKEQSILYHVRKKIGLSKTEEYPVKIVVLKKPGKEIHQDFGVNNFTYETESEALIVLCSDNRLGDLEHEYAHSQSTGISVDFQDILFRGINEGLTELTVTNPLLYAPQRAFLSRLFRIKPTYKTMLYKMYMGNQEARKEFFHRLINDFDIGKLLVIARISPKVEPSDHMSYISSAKRIYDDDAMLRFANELNSSIVNKG